MKKAPYGTFYFFSFGRIELIRTKISQIPVAYFNENDRPKHNVISFMTPHVIPQLNAYDKTMIPITANTVKSVGI